MKFPGGKLLHGWDLAVQRISLDDLLRSCEDVALTGSAEIQLASGAGVILFYKGGETSVVYRDNGSARHGPSALESLRAAVARDEGTISIYELPLDMAHLLRGLTNRRRMAEAVAAPEDLAHLLDGLRQREHTGLLEIQTPAGSAAVLLVNGRLSNTYWEGADGRTLEKDAARASLQQALTGEPAVVFLSDFSRDVWKSRHDVVAPDAAAREGAPHGSSAAPAGGREAQLRADLLQDIDDRVPAMVQALVFDLMTRTVLARRIRGTSALASMQIVERIPELMMHLREAHASDGDDVDLVRIDAGRTATLIARVAGIEEGIAVVIDTGQPATQALEVLTRLVHEYSVYAAVFRGPSV